MAVKHAVLGLVIERPAYGYKLARRLEDRCGSWGWQRAGVYGALDQLARENLVIGRPHSGARSSQRAAPRTIYEATPEGIDYFREWLLESSPPNPMRQDLDLKILLSEPEFLPQLIDQTWAQEQQCLQKLKTLAGGVHSKNPSEAATWPEARRALQRDAEMKLCRVRLEWLQDARRVMKVMLAGSAEASRGRPA
jgi:DNA-binding PadR family transcriptional regulator